MATAAKPISARFLIIWSGQLVSGIGSGLTAFALGVYAFDRTHSATVYSLIILFAFLPSYLLKPIGGTLADRFDRRLMMMLGDMGSALGLLFILLMFLSGMNDLWVIYTGTALSSVFVALQNPAYKASVTDLLDEENYAKASGLVQLTESVKYLISPIVAGFLMHYFRIEVVLVIDIATFGLAICTVLAVKKTIAPAKANKPDDGFWGEFKQGFRYTFAHKELVILLIVVSLVTFFIGFIQSLFGPLILPFADAKTLGISQTIAATGMLFSSFFIGMFHNSKNQVKILAVSLAVAGVFYAMFGTSTNIVLVTAYGFLFFAALPFVNTSIEVLIRKKVDNEVQGRVWSIVSLISQLGMIVAFAIAGTLADQVFNPMLQPNGALASTVGWFIGTGNGRGIGLMFMISGVLVLITSVAICRLRSIKHLG